MNIQAMVDGLSAQLQREHAKTQMTLGKLIAELEAMPAAAHAHAARLQVTHNHLSIIRMSILDHLSLHC